MVLWTPFSPRTVLPITLGSREAGRLGHGSWEPREALSQTDALRDFEAAHGTLGDDDGFVAVRLKRSVSSLEDPRRSFTGTTRKSFV